jgi:hypothetical protein
LQGLAAFRAPGKVRCELPLFVLAQLARRGYGTKLDEFVMRFHLEPLPNSQISLSI